MNKSMTNSIGMILLPIAAGSFDMGVDSTPLPIEITRGARGITFDRLTGEGDYDESPVHRVTISRGFLIGETEVTLDQYRLFRPDFVCDEYWSPSVAGVSWHDAVAFCAWLSERERKPYRLPTEAEWEYVCRAGMRTPFSSGDGPLERGVANAWGVKNMHAGVPEWCLDWHGLYPARDVVDPVGPAHGTAKVVRGGGLDVRKPSPEHDTGQRLPAELPYFRRSANRASAPPDFASNGGHIGFRVVQAEMPTSEPWPAAPRLFSIGVESSRKELKASHEATVPHFRTRRLFPDLGEHDMRRVGWKIGLPSGLGSAYHNSAVAVCDNGDLVAAYYNTTKWEDDPEQSLLTMRLRAGASEWDFPEPWPDFADAACAAPVFWNDARGTLWLFFGCPRLAGGPPFFFMTSRDSGATWSEIHCPKLVGDVGAFTAQPINSVVHDRDGVIHLAVDGAGATSLFFASDDNGATWRDTGGRTAGRHTSFVLGADGKTLIGFGGKNSHVDGFMPMSVSRDGGATYEHSATPFMPLASGQRPSVIRLASGAIFFVADTLGSKAPGGRSASCVALSRDEGTTWRKRELPIASTVGYVTATQAPDGIIHVVTSKTKPAALHVELNEAWIESDEPATADSFTDTLNGTKRLTDSDGKPQWECTFVEGRKSGAERFWDGEGVLAWAREHEADGAWNWQVFDPPGQVRAISRWSGKALIDYRLV